MTNYSLKTIVEMLNGFVAKMLQEGVDFAAARRHYEVSIEHVLLKILEVGDNDITSVLHYFKIDQDKLWQALLNNLNAQQAGNQGKPGFSPLLYKWLEQALLVNSLHYQQSQIRSLALLDALIQMSMQLPGKIGEILQDVSLDQLHKNGLQLISQSVENHNDYQSIEIDDKEQNVFRGDTALTRFTHDVSAKAEAGKIDPVIGRENEIRLMLDVLMRRRKNNPILVGEPGVGKTAIVEGLALHIAEQKVPEVLQNVRVHTLDLGLLQAGAGVKGEFEKRLQQVIEEVKTATNPILLFIDEAHTLIGAGDSAGGSDAANLLKPMLARGELRTIAATTWAEYKQYFERDAALDRRFQLIKVEEPSVEKTIQILTGLKSIYQQHHDILITDEAIAAAANLSHRYITAKQLPDKAIDLIDTAAARIKIGNNVMPSNIESLVAHQHYLEQRLEDLADEQKNGIYRGEEDTENGLKDELLKTKEQLHMLQDRWKAEKALVDEIKQQRDTIKIILRAKKVDKAKFAWMQAAIAETQQELLTLQKDKPMLQTELNAEVIADVVSDLTRVPVNNLLKDDVQKLLDLEITLKQNIIGQDHAISSIAEMIRTRRVGLGNEETPLGVFLLTGPSGVGKTETARIVANTMFGGERFLTTINMSEYQEAHTIAQLKGAPPGYVGYGEGGILTEAVRQRPYSVLLLDEIEKAHPDILNMFYQIFDKGIMRDGEGREINFRNTIILMTSNLGAEKIHDLSHAEDSSYTQIKQAIRPQLLHHFPTALLARMQVVPYVSLTQMALTDIVALKLDKLAQRLQKTQKINLRASKELLDNLAAQAVAPDRGARAINNIIEQQIEPCIAKSILQFLADETMPEYLSLELSSDGNIDFVYSNADTKVEVAENVA